MQVSSSTLEAQTGAGRGTWATHHSHCHILPRLRALKQIPCPLWVSGPSLEGRRCRLWKQDQVMSGELPSSPDRIQWF